MAGVECLALLAGPAIKFQFVPGGFGDGLARAELAGLLSGMNTLELCFAQAKYMADYDAYSRLCDGVTDMTQKLAVSSKPSWKIVNGSPCLRNMACAAVSEVVLAPVCLVCEGSKIIDGHICHECNGEGVVRRSGRDLARKIGVSNTSWLECWLVRYSLVYDFLQDIDNNIKSLVYKNSR